jgi:hypothetical protein
MINIIFGSVIIIIIITPLYLFNIANQKLLEKKNNKRQQILKYEYKRYCANNPI